MRCCRLSTWICLLLILAVLGCGAAPQGVNMAAREGDDAGPNGALVLTGDAPPEEIAADEGDWVFTNVTSALPESSLPPADDKPQAVESTFPGAFTVAPAPTPVPRDVATMIAPDEASPSTSHDWPMVAHRAPATARAMTEAVPVEIPPALPAAHASIDEVDEIVRNLKYGNVVYNAPTQMRFGESRVIEVLLSPTQTVQLLTAVMRSPVDVQSASLQVGNRMEAKLSGSGFDVESLSEPLQAVTSTRPTQWRFKVRPIAHGPQELHLSLLAHIDVEGRDAPLVVETKDALIEVNITLGQRVAGFVSGNWQWLWAAVVVPALGLAWKRKTGRVRRRYAPA